MCGNSGTTNDGYLDNYTWLIENIGQYEGSSGSYGYWLETPRSIGSEYVLTITGNMRDTGGDRASLTGDNGVRPVITIKTSDIE